MILEAKQISQRFHDRQVLESVNVSVKSGEYVCLIGKSGCGKSTLLNIVTGMRKPEEGEVICDGDDIYQKETKLDLNELRSKRIGYMNYGNCLLHNLTVIDNLYYPLLMRGDHPEKKKLREILKELEIDHIRNNYPSELSAGEYRRVCFARILALDPELYVLDEPTSNLDDESATIIARKIDSLSAKEGKGILIATHDQNLMKGTVVEL